MTTGRGEKQYVRAEYEAGVAPGVTPEQYRERARQAAYMAEQQGEQFKQSVASGLHTAARTLERGQPGLATRAAEPLERSAQYLESHSIPQIGSDARRTAREHPLWTAAGVFAAAFLVGRLLRRR